MKCCYGSDTICNESNTVPQRYLRLSPIGVQRSDPNKSLLGPSTPVGSGVKSIPRGAALKYKLADNGPVFFQRGTGGGFCKAEMLRLMLQLVFILLGKSEVFIWGRAGLESGGHH